MTAGERLLDLTIEYKASKESRGAGGFGGDPIGREPSEIAAEYEEAIRSLLAD